jgi:hypothetical protein
MKVTVDGRYVTIQSALNRDSGTIGMTALLKHELVDREWQRLIHVSAERSHKAFKRQRVSGMKAGHLGGLGSFGVPVLEIKELYSLLPRIGKEVWKIQIGLAGVGESLQILIGTGKKDVTHW